jgi:uncharacterized protein (TIGR03382 family)
MKYALAIVAIAGLATAANAATAINFDVSNDGGATWSSSVAGAPGQTIYVRMRLALTGATAMGLSGITAQPVLSNWDAGDVRNGFTFPGIMNDGSTGTETAYDGRAVRTAPATNVGRIFPYGAGGQGVASSSGLLTSFVDAGNRLRFAGSKNTTETTNVAWGLAISQQPASLGGTNYNQSINTEVFRYSITLGAAHSADMVAGITQVSGGLVKWYLNAGGTSILNDNAITVNNGTISFIPAPGAMALLGLGGLVATRRRRA